MKKDRLKTELSVSHCLRAVDLVNTDVLTDKFNEFRDELDLEPLDETNLLEERSELLKIFWKLYGRDTHKYEDLLVEAAKANVEFVNKVSHFIDTVRREAESFLKGKKAIEGPEED